MRRRNPIEATAAAKTKSRRESSSDVNMSLLLKILVRNHTTVRVRSHASGLIQCGAIMRGRVWVFVGTASIMLASAQVRRTQVPVFEPDPLWSQGLPNKWVNGQVGGVAVDSHDNLWVFHRPATIPDGEKAASLNP